MDETVAAVWRELLAAEKVSRHDNSFELGGNSFQSIRAAFQFERRTGLRVDPRELFFRSLAQIALTLEPQGGERT